MSFTTQSERYFDYDTDPYVTKEAVHFDNLIKSDQLDDASEFIRGQVDSLAAEVREHGYTPHFFDAALKEIAMPMYRKMHSDKHGAQYPEARSDVMGMYAQSVNLMRLLDDLRKGHGVPPNSLTTDIYNEIRGDMTELTVFALAVRNMRGIGDDITIMPSNVRQDVGDPMHRRFYTGFDFTVYDRVRDCPYPLQVKTRDTDKRYHPFIAVLPMTYFTEPLHVTVEDLQVAIMNDADKSSNFLHKAGRRMNGILSNALKDVFTATDAMDDADRQNDALGRASA